MIKACTDPDSEQWLELRSALWPQTEREEHFAEMAKFASEPGKYVQFIFYAAGDNAAGLAEASLRSDYVNGTESLPVAFLEGLYVSPEYRRQGLAAALVNEIKIWASEKSCKELASDVSLDNTGSQSFHEAIGFKETERVIYYKMSVFGG